MKRKLVNTLWAVGLLAVVSLCLPACDRVLEVQQAYDFTLETMLPQTSWSLCWSPLYSSLLSKRG